MTGRRRRGPGRVSEEGVRALVASLVRAPRARRWRLEPEVRESAAHLAIAEALAIGGALDEPAFRCVVERRYASELRCEARRRRRQREREVPLPVDGAGGGWGGSDPTPEALTAAAELAALVERTARTLTVRRRCGRRAEGAGRQHRCGAGAASAGVAAPSSPPSEATTRRWRAQERDAIRRAAREVMGR